MRRPAHSGLDRFCARIDTEAGMDLEPVRKLPGRREEVPPPIVATARLGGRGRIPPLLSVAAMTLVVGLVVGTGLGYRLGQDAPTPVRPTPTATPPDLQPDTISKRLDLAFQSQAPHGWAVCDIADSLVCHDLIAATTEMPRWPSVPYGQGWYTSPALTSVHIGQAHNVLGATLGDGSVLAFLNRVSPGDKLNVSDLTPVSPGRAGQYFFDLGKLEPGHYVIQVDFIAVPGAEGSGRVTFYLVGFVVG
jgi:hypothetical protein